jgi:hypothetical protein
MKELQNYNAGSFNLFKSIKDLAVNYRQVFFIFGEYHKNEGKKKILLMPNNIYFHGLKKTGPLVETRWPLRLLDMRIFNCFSCAEITACNRKNLFNSLPEIFLFRILNPIVKRT